MKRYLWVVLALLFVNVNASLKDDFAQMDQAEDDLLSQIRSSAALGGAEEIVEERVTIESVQSEEGVESVPANVTILTANNTEGKITTKTIEAAFEKAGFFINDNRDMLPPFKRSFKTVDFDVYTLFTTFKKDVVVKLGKKYPKIGLFSPMSMSIYTRKGTNTISVSSLNASAMAEIMGIPANDPDLVAYGKLVQETLKSALPNGKVETVQYTMKKPEGELVSTAQFAMNPEEDWEEVKDQFQADFEAALIPEKFINAGFNDLNYEFEESEFEAYNFYDVYSICYLEVIYTVSKTHPEAGAFAPCSMYMYQKKGSDTMEIGFPSVYNWIASLAIEEKPSYDVLIMAQKKMEKILDGLTTKDKSASAVNASEERAEAIRKKAMAELAAKKEAAKKEAAKKEAEKISQEKAKALQAEMAKKAAAKQQEAEKREVEAYEKQRAKNLALEKAKQESEKASMKKNEQEKEKVESTETMLDVDVAAELEAQTKAADEEYARAVEEMQQED